MIANLKNASPGMHHLYEALKTRPTAITEEEVAIASGQKVLSQAKMFELVGKLKMSNQTIRQAFERQIEAAAVRPDSFFVTSLI